ncbi:MAG: hypothetical protein BWX77_00284 [Bacteroidetes bacterium ADurb.Bin090]|jgi:hypothetical protein|nr:MAG: hypothetical protein BWX77_00284 [Bacteroidetes bacterium ADurb.Bin090]
MEKVVIKTAKFRNTQVNGRAVDYTVVRHKDNDNFIKDTNDECLIRIILTRFALIGWGFVDNLDTDKLIKITFPFAVKFITEKLKDGTLKEFEEIIISREDDFFPYPFDLNKIDKIEGFVIEFNSEKADIGKQIQANLIADSIIELRDNINALIYSKNKDILLKLGQERNILHLFRTIDNQEQFSYAIATLGNLVNDLNVDFLRKVTSNTDRDIKSFGLLELFLNSIDNTPNKSIEIFKTINRIRQGFPIHTDKAEIIKNLNKVGIEYPIENHNDSWQILLKYYKSGLTDLLNKIKKYAPQHVL